MKLFFIFLLNGKLEGKKVHEFQVPATCLSKNMSSRKFVEKVIFNQNFPLVHMSEKLKYVLSMAIPVTQFQVRGYNIRMIFLKNQHTRRILLNFENWCSGNQAMTEAAIFTIGRSRTIGYGKIRPLANYRSRSRLLNLKKCIQST